MGALVEPGDALGVGVLVRGPTAYGTNGLADIGELAGLVAFAISDEAPHMTGTILKVDAGRTSA